VDVNCAAGAGCPADSLRRIPAADANLFFAPERCLETAEYLRSA
jgi:hypothetical protein